MPFKEGDFYKVVGPDCRDLYLGQDDYRELVGWALYLTTPVAHEFPRVCTGDVLHASKRLTDALEWTMANCPSKRVFVVRGTPVARDSRGSKHGFREYEVVREVLEAELLEVLQREIRGTPRWMGWTVPGAARRLWQCQSRAARADGMRWLEARRGA